LPILSRKRAGRRGWPAPFPGFLTSHLSRRDALVPVPSWLEIPSQHDWWDFLVEPARSWTRPPGDHGFFASGEFPFPYNRRTEGTHNGRSLCSCFAPTVFRFGGRRQIASEPPLPALISGLIAGNLLPGRVGKADRRCLPARDRGGCRPGPSSDSEDLPLERCSNSLRYARPEGLTRWLGCKQHQRLSACATRRELIPILRGAGSSSSSTAKSLFAPLA